METSSSSKESFLRKTLERLSSTQSLKLQTEEVVPVAVIGLQRYLSEQTEGVQPQVDSYSYDVTLTDGVWQAKCFLDRTLNQLVHKNILRTGTDVSITEWSFVYSERRVGHGYICIEKLRCVSESSGILPHVTDVTSLPVLVKHGMESMALLGDVPLQVSRKHYLSLWNNDDPEGNVWRPYSPTPDVVLDVSKIMLLCDLESSFRNTWKPLPLLVRIIHKSRLRYYGKFGLKIDYPYQAYFEVADQSGTMSLVLWNELCPEFYQRLNTGTVLYLQNYTLKQSYSNRSHPQMDHHRMKNFSSVEICLNPRNPASVVTMVSPKSVLPQWRLPDVSYQFTTRSELQSLGNNSACDVIGLVTFVGRVERVRSKGNKGPEKYWTYRWVHAIDGTSNHPFILEIFSSSQPEVFNHVCPMTYLVCTQMRVCHVEGSLPYLTSSCETEMFITGYHKGQPYVTDPRVKSFIQWTKTLKDNVVLQKTRVGGHYCYPHAPRTFTQPVAHNSAQVPLVAAADLKRELESLQYREHKRLAIQGQIMAVRYLKCPKNTGLQGMDKEQVLDLSNMPEETVPDTQSNQREVAELPETSETSHSGEKLSASKRKRKLEISGAQLSCVTRAKMQTIRTAGRDASADRQEEEEEGKSESEELPAEECGLQQPNSNQGTFVAPQVNSDHDRLSWESNGWSRQRQEVSEHLCQGGLYQQSVSQRFTFEQKSALLQWSNLHPSQWTPEHCTDTIPPAVCPGYYQTTILGINKQIAVDAAFFPVAWSEDPRAVGLPQEPHGNTMLSCLSSGFLCPLSDPGGQSDAALPQPEEILASVKELEDTHLVCVLNLCHLSGDDVEVVIQKVYRVTDLSLA
ncbi:RPA-related protein RADX [Myripristis murdjan]|uniref:RPA1 related single stranded DNA binding protein n=1 Tax=Myripristis murdjan TaxID=586833 RepID=A0A667XH75_9TELE|nr:RPA-related protein RADX [Myripristis murdjan]